MTYTVVPYAHTVVVYVDGGGEPLINMGPSKLFSSSGGTPDKEGALKVVVQ